MSKQRKDYGCIVEYQSSKKGSSEVEAGFGGHVTTYSSFQTMYK